MRHLKNRIQSARRFSAAMGIAACCAAAITPASPGIQETGRVVVSAGGPGGLLDHGWLPAVRTPHGYHGEALRLHNKYLHAGLTKRNVFRSSRQFSPFGNVFRSSRHYQQKLYASIDAYPLRTIGHPIRVIGNDFDEVVPPSFIAGSGGRYGYHDQHLSPLDAAHHYFDPDLITPVPYFGHYEPDTSHYGPSNFISNRDRTGGADEPARPSMPEWWTDDGDDDPSQQAVTLRVRQPDGTRKIVITSEPIPSSLDEAWATLAAGDDAGAAEQFGELTNPGGHATDLTRQARLGAIIAQAALTLSGQASPDVVASMLNDAIDDDPQLLDRLPDNDAVVRRVEDLTKQMSSQSQSGASQEAYGTLAEAIDQLTR